MIFVLLGSMQGTLASRMPALKTNAGLDDGLLGLALLGIPLGSILAVQVTGRWIGRRGSSPVTNVGVIFMCAAVVTPAFAPGFVTLLAALTMVGIGIGLTDTAMNTHAVTVEKGYRRPIMSSFHGFASLGNLLGALGGLVAAYAGVPPRFDSRWSGALGWRPACWSALLCCPVPPMPRWLIVTSSARSRPRDPWSGTLVLLAGIALLAWMTEHAIGDWSAVYFRDHLNASGSVATYGYASFATCMVVTRFLADRLTARLGPAWMLRCGGLVAGIGLGAGLISDSLIGATIGCGLVGIGMAGIVPIVFTAAGNLPGISAGSAVSKVAGVAFAGSLIGPPLIGLTADLTSLRTGLFLVAAAALVIGLAGPAAVRRSD